MFRPWLVIAVTVMTLAARIPSTAALEVGDAAPKLQVSQWCSGQAVKSWSETGDTVHVVAFWATWSTPARESLVGLASLQRELDEKNVTIIAVSDEQVVDIRGYLDERPETRVLSVCADDSGRSTTDWLKAAGESVVPHAFVVDRAGRIAWHGHPSRVKTVLEQVLAGTWEVQPPKSEPLAATEPDQNQQPSKALAEVLREAFTEPVVPDPDRDSVLDGEPRSPIELRRMLGWAVQSNEWNQAVALIDELVQQLGDHEEVPDLLSSKFVFLYEMLEDFERAEAAARDLLALDRDDAGALNTLAWTLLARGNVESLDHRWPGIAHEAAQRALEASASESAGIIDTYARSLYMLGHIEAAASWQRRAVERMTQILEDVRQNGDARSIERSEYSLQSLQGTLEYYDRVLAVRKQTAQ